VVVVVDEVDAETVEVVVVVSGGWLSTKAKAEKEEVETSINSEVRLIEALKLESEESEIH